MHLTTFKEIFLDAENLNNCEQLINLNTILKMKKSKIRRRKLNVKLLCYIFKILNICSVYQP